MTRDSMRIALISSSFHPHVGGVEEHVRQVAKELMARGHHVEVWTVDRGEHLGVQHVDEVEVRYLPTPLPASSPGAVLAFARTFPTAWWQWRTALRSFRPQVLNVHCFGPNGVYATALSLITRTPLVVSSHGETFMDEHDVFGQSRLLRASLRTALRSSAAVTGCSSMVIDDLKTRFGLRSGRVVPNGVTIHPPSDSELPVFPRPYVFAVGRMVRVKGFDLLIRAFAQADLPNDVHLVIGGDGPERSPLQQLGQDLGLADRLHLPGAIARAAVIPAMANAAVVAIPSRVEAFGIVVLEAWQSGTPLIVTRRGGPADFVHDNESGLLVDPENTDAFARALRKLLADSALASTLATEGSDRVSEFTWSRVVDDYVDILAKTIHRGTSLHE